MPITWSWSQGERSISVSRFPRLDWTECEKPIHRAQGREISGVKQETLLKLRSSTYPPAVPQLYPDSSWLYLTCLSGLQIFHESCLRSKVYKSRKWWFHEMIEEIRTTGAFFCLFYFVFWWHVIFSVYLGSIIQAYHSVWYACLSVLSN